MRHMYISHCVVTDAFNKATDAEVNSYFKKMKEFGKEHGFDLIFWGNPWGVSESLTFVATSEKSLDGYIGWRMAWSQKASKDKLPTFYQASNTTIVTAIG